MSGTIETDTLSLSAEDEATAIVRTREIQARMSPAGALGLPPLLDARRLEHGIIDAVFDQQPLFDRVFVFQIEAKWAQGQFFPGTSIIQPESSKKRREREAPVGIIVSAGQKALDVLRANGVDLGHIITHIRLGMWRMPVGEVGGMEVPVCMLRVGDLTSSFDLAANLRASKVSITLDEKTQQHVFNDDRTWLPSEPDMLEG